MQLRVFPVEGAWPVGRRGSLPASIAEPLNAPDEFKGLAREVNSHLNDVLGATLVINFDDSMRRWDAVSRSIEESSFTLDVDPASRVADVAQRAYVESVRLGFCRPFEEVDVESENGWFYSIDRSEPNAFWLERSSGDRLDDELMVSECNLDELDDVVVRVRHQDRSRIHASYMLLPVGDPGSLLSIAGMDALRARRAMESNTLWGALLYTEEDVEIARYVRERFNDLNIMSGPDLHIFVVERPTSYREAKSYWQRYLSPEVLRTYRLLNWMRWRPLDKSGCYAVAQELDVEVDELPCLVLFDSPKQSVVFPLNRSVDQSRYFRTLISLITAAMGESPRLAEPNMSANLHPLMEMLERAVGGEDYAGLLSKVATAEPSSAAGIALSDIQTRTNSRSAVSKAVAAYNVRRRRNLIIDSLAEVVEEGGRPPRKRSYRASFYGNTVFIRQGESVSESFNFYGSTSFVNRPTTSVISDFQNVYGEGSAKAVAPELTRVLQLILESSQLPLDKKEEAAVLVHEAAMQIGTGPEGDVVASSKLDKVKDIVSGVVGIGAPIVKLIAKVYETFNT